MKTILISLIVLTLSAQMCSAQRTFKFKIDQTSYDVGEEKLNELFGDAFNDMVNKGWTDASHFQLWTSSFNDWKDHIVLGTFSFVTYGNRVGGSSYSGPDIAPEYLGWDKKPGRQGSGNPNKEKNVGRRMGMLRDAVSTRLIFYLTNKVIVN